MPVFETVISVTVIVVFCVFAIMEIRDEDSRDNSQSDRRLE